jgi:hypothetical protein
MNKSRTSLVLATVLAAFAAGVLTARPVVSQPVSARGPIAVGWWSQDGSNASWGAVHEAPRPGDYIRSSAGEQSYRVVLKVATLSDGSVRLRVGPPGEFVD